MGNCLLESGSRRQSGFFIFQAHLVVARGKSAFACPSADSSEYLRGIDEVYEHNPIDEAQEENETEMGDSASPAKHVVEGGDRGFVDERIEPVIENHRESKPNKIELRADDPHDVAFHIRVIPKFDFESFHEDKPGDEFKKDHRASHDADWQKVGNARPAFFF